MDKKALPVTNPKLSKAEEMAVHAVRAALVGKLRGANLKDAFYVVDCGVINANDTVFAENKANRSEWLDIFRLSMACMLTAKPTSENVSVLAAFRSIGVEG